MANTDRESNLARIRDNQRRSRARRREYTEELEKRLRVCETQGVEATAEVQAAARRVAEENRQLRELLVSSGFSDDEIVRYLQSARSTSQDSAQSGASGSNAAGFSLQSLEQAIVPRRPAILDAPLMMPLPAQARREVSTGPVPMGNAPSGWAPTRENSMTPIHFEGHHAVMDLPPPNTYHPIILQPGDIARMEAFETDHAPGRLNDQGQHQIYTQRSLAPENNLNLAFNHLAPHHLADPRTFGPSSGR